MSSSMADPLQPVHFVRFLESKDGITGYGKLRRLRFWDETTYLVTLVGRADLAPSNLSLCSGDETSTVVATLHKPWEEP